MCLGATTWEQLSGGCLKLFLFGQTDGDKASYSPSPCFHLLNSPSCSPGRRIHGEQKWGLLYRSLRQELRGVLFVCLMHYEKDLPRPLFLSLVDGKKRQPQNHGSVSSDNLLWAVLQPHSVHQALSFSQSCKTSALHSFFLCNP